MNHVSKAMLALCAVLALAACDSGKTAKTTPEETVQISAVAFNAVAWDEVAAADTAAQVNNTGLIMMR